MPTAAQSPPGHDETPVTSTAEEAALAAEVKAMLAKELGVPLDQLHDDTDLVKDLNLDQGEVYNAVQTVLDAYGAMQAGQELTRVADIIHAAEQAKTQAAAPALPPDLANRRFRMQVTRSDRSGEESYVQTVYYVTDRRPTGDSAPENYFGGNRSEQGALSYGRAEVNIPKSHKMGMIETPWLEIKAFQQKSHHIFILRLDPANAQQFFGDIAGQDGDVVVYVHGFNVSFEDAILRTAQLAVDFGFKGTPIVYSWPSAASLTSYNSDWENVNWSAEHIERFLEELAEKVKGRKIDLVAHSMGSKGLLNALRMLALRGKTDMFGTVILCAPDFDAGLFAEQIAVEIKPLAAQWVIYTSNKDVALMASEQINTLRLGTPVTLAEGYEIIDASEVEVTPWSVPETHSYYATKKIVLDDMVSALKGLSPVARKLKQNLTAAGIFWTLSTPP
jgi:esterase/lipase superfamily enzyme